MDNTATLCAVIQVVSENKEVIKLTLRWQTLKTRIWEQQLMVE